MQDNPADMVLGTCVATLCKWLEPASIYRRTCSPGLHEESKRMPGDTGRCRPCCALHTVLGGA